VKRVVYEPRALAELEHELRWYERRAPGEGERLLGIVDAVIHAIAESPERFPLDRWHPLARRALLPKQTFPFSVVFTIRTLSMPRAEW
jgi:plasmid stabilization system protein ParE